MGGIIIQYTATTFVEPKPLSETEYEQMKIFLTENPYKPVFIQENTDGMYKNHYRTMAISFGVLVLCFIINYFFGDITLTNWIALISAIVFFSSIYRYYLESSSYLKYEKDRDKYFLRMKFAIIHSQNFNEFNKYFYTIFSRHFDQEYVLWKKLYSRKKL